MLETLRTNMERMEKSANGSAMPDVDFSGTPPFPHDIVTLELPRISIGALQRDDATEARLLFEACKTLGFFLLDLRDDMNRSAFLERADQVIEIGQKVFSLEMADKMTYHVSKDSFEGYKSQGVLVVDEDGTKDRFESYNVAKDYLLGPKDVASPPIITERKAILCDFMERSHSIITTILDSLDSPLDLPAGKLSSLHRMREPAVNYVRVNRCPPQPMGDRRTSIVPHTDFGTLTILFNKVGGLQVLAPGPDGEWMYIQPVPGHAIVNVGDALTRLTRGLLRSCWHRVAAPPGAQAACERYSLAYLARPEDSTTLRGLEGSRLIPKLAEGEFEDSITIRESATKKTVSLNAESFQGKEWKRFFEAKS